MRRETFLIELFESFCRELIRLVRVVESGAEPSSPEAAAGDEREGEIAPSGIRRRLLRLLKRQALEVGAARGSAAAELYGQAQYVMAALADETLLNLDRKGSEQWRSHLLESELFQTHRAGEEIFSRIDQLLLDRDPLQAELAQLYLLALGLGFQGRFRGAEPGAQSLSHYRQRLLELVATWDPELLDTAPPLVPEAYTSTLAEGSGAKLPYLRPWVLALGGIVVTWILVAHGLWRHLVSEIEPLIQAILQ